MEFEDIEEAFDQDEFRVLGGSVEVVEDVPFVEAEGEFVFGFLVVCSSAGVGYELSKFVVERYGYHAFEESLVAVSYSEVFYCFWFNASLLEVCVVGIEL